MSKYLLIFFFAKITLFAQNYNLNRTIDSLSILNKDSLALNLMQYKSNQKNKSFYYNKACFFSCLNKLDSSVHYINLYLQIKTPHYDIWYDNSFDNVRNSTKWHKIDSMLQSEFNMEYSNVKNHSLTRAFLRYGIIDQNYRGEWIRTKEIFKDTSYTYTKIKNEIDSIDKLSELFIQHIFDSCQCWPGISNLGSKPNQYGVLLYQHTTNEFRVKYYNYMKVAFEKKEITNNEFAIITDRVLIGKGKKQIYGSQYKRDKNNKLILSGKVKIDQLNRNRKKIDLPPLKIQ